MDHQPSSFKNYKMCQWEITLAVVGGHGSFPHMTPLKGRCFFPPFSCGKGRGLQKVLVCFRTGQPPGTDCFLSWSVSRYVFGRRGGSPNLPPPRGWKMFVKLFVFNQHRATKETAAAWVTRAGQRGHQNGRGGCSKL